MNKPLVTVDWLMNNMEDPSLVILDATIKKAGEESKDKASDLKGIKGALFLDMKKKFADVNNDLPNTMPTPEQYIEACKELGITNDSKIVIYDKHGIYSSPRAWWIFKTMGHKDIAVLNGGFPEWIKNNGPVRNFKKKVKTSVAYNTNVQNNLICDSSLVMIAKDNKSFLILDARSEGRFDGTSPEPRPELRGGHIPNSINLPYTRLIRDHKFLPQDELKYIYDKINPNRKNLIFSCGSGITACVLALGANIVGHSFGTVYDGSWSEWGLPSKLPVELKKEY